MKKLLIALFLIAGMVGGLAAQAEPPEAVSPEAVSPEAEPPEAVSPEAEPPEAEPLKAVSSDLGLGVWEHFYAPTGNKIKDEKSLLLGLRFGGFAAVRVNLSDILSVGGEMGLSYTQVPFPEDTSLTFFDIYLHAVLRVKLGKILGKIIAIQPYIGGLLGTEDTGGLLGGPDKVSTFNMDAGAKFLVGDFFIDAGVVISTAPTAHPVHPRFGIGFQFKDIF